jgi:hypothetical protein
VSHVDDLNVVAKDLDCLRKAVLANPHLEWRENQKTFNWWGRHVGDHPLPPGMRREDMGKCEHAIVVRPDSPFFRKCNIGLKRDQPYEMGVIRRKDGKGWSLMYDFIGGGYGLSEALTNGKMKDVRNSAQCLQTIQPLMQEYGLQVSEKEMEPLVAEGWQIERIKQPNGDVQLRVHKE